MVQRRALLGQHEPRGGESLRRGLLRALPRAIRPGVRKDDTGNLHRRAQRLQRTQPVWGEQGAVGGAHGGGVQAAAGIRSDRAPAGAVLLGPGVREDTPRLLVDGDRALRRSLLRAARRVVRAQRPRADGAHAGGTGFRRGDTRRRSGHAEPRPHAAPGHRHPHRADAGNADLQAGLQRRPPVRAKADAERDLRHLGLALHVRGAEVVGRLADGAGDQHALPASHPLFHPRDAQARLPAALLPSAAVVEVLPRCGGLLRPRLLFHDDRRAGPRGAVASHDLVRLGGRARGPEPLERRAEPGGGGPAGAPLRLRSRRRDRHGRARLGEGPAARRRRGIVQARCGPGVHHPPSLDARSAPALLRRRRQGDRDARLPGRDPGDLR